MPIHFHISKRVPRLPSFCHPKPDVKDHLPFRECFKNTKPHMEFPNLFCVLCKILPKMYEFFLNYSLSHLLNKVFTNHFRKLASVRLQIAGREIPKYPYVPSIPATSRFNGFGSIRTHRAILRYITGNI